MNRRRLPYDINPDERTDTMTAQALMCRAAGHVWVLQAMSRKRYRDLINEGCMEWNRHCDNGCGATWRQLFNIRNGQIIENERRYPTNGTYLLKPGTGRLHRNEARVAHFARTYRTT